MDHPNDARHRSTPAWTRTQASDLRRTDATVAPIVYPPAERIDPDVHIWDTWVLRNRDGTIAEIDGWRVFFSLSAPSHLLPGKRHDIATIRYFYSRSSARPRRLANPNEALRATNGEVSALGTR